MMKDGVWIWKGLVLELGLGLMMMNMGKWNMGSEWWFAVVQRGGAVDVGGGDGENRSSWKKMKRNSDSV
ncbi:hypothetical protein L195_g014672 [Trifolium pratense]|uniref:Uncharacterized protein n=1 Tax=Trifolium pratense TaxID=57577 RepID=A0A2K3PR05_TRIPR|nr:hypothetical protein L195_g003891 [Trifolium pratense]PNY17704.1 hypothetical protein L195_g014453 [Trifolium pratense]PNY17916.1 hypothetical protein L195_g014672 [Trifolium pratense]